MLFELIGAPHVQKNENGVNVEYRKGDRIETDKDLCRMFRGKFKLLSGEPVNAAVPSQPEINKSVDVRTAATVLAAEATTAAEATASAVRKLASGLDMTITFPGAKEKSLSIMKIDEDQFQITKNGFIEVNGIFTRAEVIILLKNIDA